MMPTMTPNRPRALPNISITRILTKSVEFWASLRAQLLPMMPTHSLRHHQDRAPLAIRTDHNSCVQPHTPIGHVCALIHH